MADLSEPGSAPRFSGGPGLPQTLEDATRALECALDEADRARRHLDALLAALDAGVLILDDGGRVRMANPAAGRITGRAVEELLDTPGERYLGPASEAGGEVVLRREDGGERCVELARSRVGGTDGAEIVLIHDVTDRPANASRAGWLDELAETMRTVGVLTHKINNPLTSLLGRAQLLRGQAGVDPRAVKAAEVIHESATRVAGLVRELAGVAREAREGPLRRLREAEGRPDSDDN